MVAAPATPFGREGIDLMMARLVILGLFALAVALVVGGDAEAARPAPATAGRALAAATAPHAGDLPAIAARPVRDRDATAALPLGTAMESEGDGEGPDAQVATPLTILNAADLRGPLVAPRAAAGRRAAAPPRPLRC